MIRPRARGAPYRPVEAPQSHGRRTGLDGEGRSPRGRRSICQESPMPDPMSQLPYFREYVEQILRPRVVRAIEDVRVDLPSYVWESVLQRLAAEQSPGKAP